MPTWTEIQDYMRRKYSLEDDRPDAISMVWSYDDGRSQKIVIRRYKAFERDMVEFTSKFARRPDADPEEILRKNAEMPLATVALTSDDVYTVVYNALLDHLHMADLDLYLSRVAAVADNLEERYARRDDF